MRTRTIARLCVVAGVVAVGGCAVEAVGTEEQANIVLPPIGSCPTEPTEIDESLVVTEPATLALFGFGKVMDAILSSVKHAPQTRLALFADWMSTYAPPACPGDGIDPDGYGLVCPRTREASLAASDPYDPLGPDFFRPVAVFNRFDLAPQDGRHCGEYRVVFAKQSTTAIDRGFLIFEAALPNPQPGRGINGCYAVARFWQSLSGMKAAKRASALEAFYFTGVKDPTTGVVIGPVITANNYGLAARRGLIRLAGYGDTDRSGQVRTNMFIDASPQFHWNLREFKLDLDCTTSPPTEHDLDASQIVRPLPEDCELRFEHVAVANNPADELFDDTHANAVVFQPAFLAKDVPTLAAVGGTFECGGGANLIGMATPGEFNEFESLSLGSTDVVYSGFTSTPFRTAIQTELTSMGSALTPTQLLDRATTQTCGGCHQHSNSVAVGGGVTWPASLGFTHVDESSNLSPALTTAFLPFRRCVLDDYIQRICDGDDFGAIDDDKTVGGQGVGASN